MRRITFIRRGPAWLFATLLLQTGPLRGNDSPPAPGGGSFPVSIRVDASTTKGDLKPVWRFFGADEPNYATMKNGRKLLGELGGLDRGAVYFRAHNLLTSGDGTPSLKWGSTGVYDEDAEGRPRYHWSILDGIFDSYRSRGVLPYVEIGFMPEAMSTRPAPYRHHWTPVAKYDEIFTGWAFPPRDYSKWEELAFQWTKHCLGRFGRAQVERWFWEVWNEPNIGYWRGKPSEFLNLHDHAVAGVRRALPTARVGGADTAGSGGGFTRAFLEHCLRGTNFANGRTGTPLDFVSFHAKGAPSFVDGHVRMGISNHLRTIDDGFSIVASFPELRNIPIVIGESDPDGCAACQGPQLGYRNTTMYSSYTAATLSRVFELAGKHQVNIEGVLTWAFEFENQPMFAGFRALATEGVDLPVLNVFRMFAKMRGRRLEVQSSTAQPLEGILQAGVRGKPEVSAMAALEGRALQVLVWHYHDDDTPGPPAFVTLKLDGLPARTSRAGVQVFRLDQNHGNSFTAWKAMGSPPQPTRRQYALLESSARLAADVASPPVPVAAGRALFSFVLPRQGVCLLIFNLAAASKK